MSDRKFCDVCRQELGPHTKFFQSRYERVNLKHSETTYEKGIGVSLQVGLEGNDYCQECWGAAVDKALMQALARVKSPHELYAAYQGTPEARRAAARDARALKAVTKRWFYREKREKLKRLKKRKLAKRRRKTR